MTRFDVRSFGATGTGYTNDAPAIQAAILAALGCNGCCYFPPGQYLIQSAIFFPTTAANISIEGDGPNVSVIFGQNCSGFNFNFAQNAGKQPWGATIRNLGFRALGSCDLAIRISYGQPDVTNDHDEPSALISNVTITSDGEGSWTNGIDLEGAWNARLSNVFISGNSFGGNWGAMAGVGVRLRGYCVNFIATALNCNFFADGFKYEGSAYGNTEGIHFANCNFVAVKRGVTVIGSAEAEVKRVSTVTWVGGLIECRVLGVTDGSAAFNFERVWTALIGQMQMLSESLETGPFNTYGVSAVNSKGIVVTGCDINAWRFGVATSGECEAISTHGNTFTNTSAQTVFNVGTYSSRSYGHVLVDLSRNEQDLDGRNMMGFTNYTTDELSAPVTGIMS